MNQAEMTDQLERLQALAAQGEGKRPDGVTVRDLSDAWGLSRGAVRRRLADMAHKGWVKGRKGYFTSPLTGTRRVTYYYILTEEGQRALGELR